MLYNYTHKNHHHNLYEGRSQSDIHCHVLLLSFSHFISLQQVLRKANTHHDPVYGNHTKLLSQRPLYQCDLSNLTTEKLENYLFLLFTLEQNLTKYRSLRKELDEVLKTVKTLNEHTGDETTAKMLFGRDSEESVYNSNAFESDNVT